MLHEDRKQRLASALASRGIPCHNEDLDRFRTDNPLVDQAREPDSVLRPLDVDQLQASLRLAAENDLAFVPVSSSAPHTLGGIICGEPHAMLDLSSWKKIESIDRRNRVCMIEPGVTYGELLGALESHGLTIPMPLAPRAGKSVLAAVMDRTPSTWPNKQWDISDPVASSEFIFGTGDRFRTGAAGGPGSLQKQREAGGAQKSPLGPSQTDLHRLVQGSQGSMGIVSWITLRAELKPSIERPFLIGTDRLEKLIPVLYEVHRPWLGEHSFVLNNTAAAMLLAATQATDFRSKRDSLPPFVCMQNIGGFERLPRERVDYQHKDIAEIVERRGLSLAASLGGVSASTLLAAATSPCGERDWRHVLRGHCLSIFFLSTLDGMPQFISLTADLARWHTIDAERMGIYLQPVIQNHACHVEFMIPFDPGQPDEVERLRRFECQAVRALSDAGAFFSRPYGAAREIAFERNPASTEVLKKMKTIFDPDRVLSPGKWGLY